MSTFKQISKQSHNQGGASIPNMTVTNELSSANPYNVYGNESFLQCMVESLPNNTTLVENLSNTPIRDYITAQLVDEATVASQIEPIIQADLVQNLSPTALIAQFSELLNSLFITPVKTALLNSTTFLLDAVSNMAQYLPIIEQSIPVSKINQEVKTYINTTIYAGGLIDNFPVYMDNLDLPYLLNSMTTELETKLLPQTVNYTIVPNFLYSEMTLPFYNINLDGLYFYTVTIINSVLLSSKPNTISAVKILAIRADTLGLNTTLFTETYSPAVTSVNIVLNKTIELTTPDAVPVYFCLLCTLSDSEAYITSTLSMTIEKSKFIPRETVLGIHPLRFDGICNGQVDVYDMINNLENTLNVDTYSLSETIQMPLKVDGFGDPLNDPAVGVILYVNSKATWNISFKNISEINLTTGDDYSVYYVFTISDTVDILMYDYSTQTFNYDPTKQTILLLKYREGFVLWVVKIDGNSSYFTIDNVYYDKSNRINLISSYVRDDNLSLTAYDSDGSNFQIVDAHSPTIERVAFDLLYDTDGNLTTFVVVTSDTGFDPLYPDKFLQNVIDSIDYPTFSNMLCFSGSTFSSNDTLISEPSRTTIVIPPPEALGSSRVFIVQRRKLSASSGSEYYITLGNVLNGQVNGMVFDYFNNDNTQPMLKVLYSVDSDVNIFDKNDITTVKATVTKDVGVDEYLLYVSYIDGVYDYHFTITSDCFTTGSGYSKMTQMVKNPPDTFGYTQVVLQQTTTPLIINLTTTLHMPATPGEFAVLFFTWRDQIRINDIYFVITNCTFPKLSLFKDEVYLEYTFNDVSTAYFYYYYDVTYELILYSIGAVGNTGNILVKVTQDNLRVMGYTVFRNTVVYNGNGNTWGVVPVDTSSPYTSGTTVTVLGNSGSPPLDNAGYEFAGWNTLPDGSGTPYSPLDIFVINSAQTLYAQWTLI